MEFEDMKKIWNAQEQAAMYVIDEQALHQQIKNKMTKGIRIADLTEKILIGSSVFAMVIVMSGALVAQNFGAFIWFLMSVFVIALGFTVWHRSNRVRESKAFGQSVTGQMELALKTAERQVKLSGVMLFGLTPLIFLFAGSTYFMDEGFSIWYLISILVFFLAVSVGAGFEHRYYLKRRERLKKMRDKLMEEI